MEISILDWFDDSIIFTHDCENNSIRLTVEMAVERKINLNGANLNGANLDGASLDGASLNWANLDGASLNWANLDGANLDGASLDGACLNWASLDVKIPPTTSHQFISEILWRAAKTEQQKDFAARIRIEKEQYWKFFISLAKTKDVFDWAKDILCKWQEFKDKIEKNCREEKK